jgi:spore coat polysaccharide biosynthesis protein SpsF (cytidylyltransferase family)
MSLKNLSEIGIIVQARLSSVRVPRKMLKPFAGTTLLDILFKKLTTSLVIPRSNIIFSAHEPQLQ